MRKVEVVDGGEKVSTTFGSPEVFQRIRGLAKNIEDAKAALAAAERKLALLRTNAGALEAVGKKPEEEIRLASSDVQGAASALSSAREQFASAFLEERKDFDVVRSEVFATFHAKAIAPNIASLRSLVGTVEAAIGGLVANLETMNAVSGDSSEADDFDEKIVGWNRFVGSLGGPGNALVHVSAAVRVSAANSFLEIAKEVMQLESAIKRLRAAASAAQTRLANASTGK